MDGSQDAEDARHHHGKHENIHKKQFEAFCPTLRDCYLEVEANKRPVNDCIAMAMSGAKERECPAYQASNACMEDRLNSAPECATIGDGQYMQQALQSDECFKNYYCGS